MALGEATNSLAARVAAASPALLLHLHQQQQQHQHPRQQQHPHQHPSQQQQQQVGSVGGSIQSRTPTASLWSPGLSGAALWSEYFVVLSLGVGIGALLMGGATAMRANRQ